MPRFNRLELDSAAFRDPVPGESAEQLRDEQHWLRMADGERRQGHHENALRYYSRALQHDKALIAGWLGQVQMLVFLGEYPEADLWAVKALELFKNHAELLAVRAQALCRKGDLSAARSICDGAFAQPEQSAFRWMVRGELMIATGQDMDRYCFDKAIQIDPDWLVPLEVGAAFRHYNQPSKALVYTRKAAALCPDNVHIWYQQAACEAELGMNEAARRSLDRCLELEPQHVDAATLLARLEGHGGFVTGLFRRLFRRS